MSDLDKHSAVLLNRINDITPDHTYWIKEQFASKKIMNVHGREIWIKAPGRNLNRIVNVPCKDDPDYKQAWVDVYNLCLDYLEGSLNVACLENKFIQRMGNVWTLNGKVIIWPKFNPNDANYARSLEKLLDAYNYIKNRYINSSLKKDEIVVKKRSVKISPINDYKNQKLKKLPKLEYEKPKEEKQVLPEHRVIKKDTIANNDIVFKDTSRKLVIQKVSDGEILNSKDLRQLNEQKTDIVVLTCQNVLEPKEEDKFLNNAVKCYKEGIKTGAFIYGRAIDEHGGASELKILLKMLMKVQKNFSGLVIYSINDSYVKENSDSDIKLLDFINMYNAILNTLKEAGFTAMLSMNLESGKIIEDINKRYNMTNEHDISYMVVVRDIDEVKMNASTIVVDPWNDYDLVNIKNDKIISQLRV